MQLSLENEESEDLTVSLKEVFLETNNLSKKVFRLFQFGGWSIIIATTLYVLKLFLKMRSEFLSDDMFS